MSVLRNYSIDHLVVSVNSLTATLAKEVLYVTVVLTSRSLRFYLSHTVVSKCRKNDLNHLVVSVNSLTATLAKEVLYITGILTIRSLSVHLSHTIMSKSRNLNYISRQIIEVAGCRHIVVAITYSALVASNGISYLSTGRRLCRNHSTSRLMTKSFKNELSRNVSYILSNNILVGIKIRVTTFCATVVIRKISVCHTCGLGAIYEFTIIVAYLKGSLSDSGYRFNAYLVGLSRVDGFKE